LLLLIGDTIVTDHVRSIVRECLQEADVQWTSSHEADVNNNYDDEESHEDEKFLDEQDSLVSPIVVSEVTANVDSESAKDNQLVEEDIDDSSNKADEEVLVMEVPLREDSVDNLESETWHLSPEPPDIDEMVSYTENARINAWKTPEVIKKASNSGVPSRVGSATTRVNANPSTPPPPQRPSSPTHPGAIPFKQADRWLAGGRDINSTSVKHVSVPLPGWMDGLDTVRRPKLSPAVRGTRQTSSHVSSRTLFTRPNTGRPVAGNAWVQVRGALLPLMQGYDQRELWCGEDKRRWRYKRQFYLANKHWIH